MEEHKINAVCKEKQDRTENRLDKLEEVTTAIYSIASDVKVMAEQMISVKADVKYLKDDKETRDRKPSTLLEKVLSTIITVIVTATVMSFYSLIMK